MTRRIRVNVTQRDIERGVQNSGGRCPVARAMRRHRPFRFASVNGLEAYVPWGGKYTLPLEVQEFVGAFDDGDPVEPFTFDLEVEL